MSSEDVELDGNSRPSIENEKGEQEIHLTRKTNLKPKPKIKPSNAIERIFGKKYVSKNHYFSAGSKVTDENSRDVVTETSPYVYPKDLEQFSFKVMSRAWRDNLIRKEMKYKYYERNSYRSRLKYDILNRLYVKEPHVRGMKTILDVDPQFFSIVEGRPVETKLNLRDYINDVRDVLRTKIIIGYRNDDMMLVDENFVEEQRMINRIKVQYQQYVDTFEEFLFNDHTSSMTLLRQSEKEANLAAEKQQILRTITKDFGALKASMYGYEEKWRNCKMYQKFLYLLSPMGWRKKYDYYHVRRSPGKENLIEETTSVFGRYKLATTGEIMSLENLIEQFLDDCRTQEEPELYFTEPSQLLQVYAYMELQNLNSLLHSEELAIPLLNVKEGMARAKKAFEDEMIKLQEMIDNLEGSILWEENRAKSLEQLAVGLINSDFRLLISDDVVLNLYVFVCDVYETRIAKNEANLSITSMMKAIELRYQKFLLVLDHLPQDSVHRAESTCYVEEARIMKIAKDAARRVVQMEQLMKKLNELLELPRYRVSKELKNRSPPIDPPEPLPPKARPLTEDEKEYLTYFTDYCEYADDLTDYGIYVDPIEKRKSVGFVTGDDEDGEQDEGGSDDESARIEILL